MISSGTVKGWISNGSSIASVPWSVVRSAPWLEVQVRSGDSLWSLAKRYGTTVDRIKQDNKLRSNTLQAGQSLVVRTGSAGGNTYIVRSGDTLGKIADRVGISLRQLLAANGLSSRSVIYPGPRLAIPR